MSDIAIRVENLSKRYRIGLKEEMHTYMVSAFSDLIARPLKNFRRLQRLSKFSENGHEPEDIIWALRDVSFEVKHGEVVGIIGRNGAGKSTLLKVLTRITYPTGGIARVNGRVGSLLEVGTGFHDELTGRENVYLNGSILGMKKAEIDRKFDEIVDFAGVEKFLDTPVKRYSSGMKVRLAFSVAAHLEPEILLVDEVLAVGDAEFQRRCLGKIEGVAREGRTILFVSHNMGAITQLCTRSVWLEGGSLKSDGPSHSVVASYLSVGSHSRSSWVAPHHTESAGAARIRSARILSLDGEPISILKFRELCKIEIGYEIRQPVNDLNIAIRLIDASGNIVWTSWDTDTVGTNERFVRQPGYYVSTCLAPSDILKPGFYQLSIGSRHRHGQWEWHEGALTFDVSAVGYEFNADRGGIVLPVFDWKIQSLDQLTMIP